MSRETERGAALVLAVLVVSVLLLTGLAFLSLGRAQLHLGASRRDSLAALDLADAGIDVALAQLRTDPQWRGPLSDPLRGYTVTVSDLDNGLLSVRSSASAGGIARAVSATVHVGLPSMYRRVLVSGGDFTFPNSFSIDGDVQANSNATLSGVGSVDGKVLVSGQFSTEWGSIDPPPTVGAPPVPLNPFPSLTGTPLSGPTVDLGNLPLQGQVYTINGDVTLIAPPSRGRRSPGVQGNAVIWVDGKVHLAGDLVDKQAGRPEDPNLLAIMASGDITVDGAVVDGVLQSRGTISFTHPSLRSIYGGLYANAITYRSARLPLRYDRRLGSSPPAPLPRGAELVSWREGGGPQ